MAKIDRVCALLDREYGAQRWTEREPVLDELIRTILSQNTAAANCNEAFARLRARFEDWKAVKDADWREIAEAISVGGLANRKAPRIKRMLEQVYDRQRNLDLEWIARTPDQQAIDYLLGFDGVGPKTAACVLMFGLGRPVLPVDTHVHRVAMRLGLIGNVSADEAHDLLQEMTPPEAVYSFHVNMVTHGRRVCHARNPECGRCALTKECDHFARQAQAR